MKPTEHEMTIAVDAAARWVFAELQPPASWARGTFEQLSPVTANRMREEVLGLVVAALEALPDRGESALVRVGTYLTDDMWCHHDGCEHMSGGPCSCGLDELLAQLDEVGTR